VKSSALATAAPGATATLTVLNGSARGEKFTMTSQRLSIGRDEENDISIPGDQKMSRRHAEILLSQNGLEIRNVSEQNIMEVDGRECRRAFLNDNVAILLGETRFQFSVHGSVARAAPSARIIPSRRHRRKPGTQTSRRPLIVLGVVGLILWFVFSGGAKKPKAPVTEDAEIKAAQLLKSAAEARRPKNAGANDLGYNQAQESFVMGFRDYRKGQYERALSSFQACLSLFPSHTLCSRYLSLTQKRFDELIQYHMVLGRKYRDQNQYSACASAYRNVMVMVKDAGNKRYLEAKANFEACQAQLEDRF
jgi:pSer/pThr/pTyr-binding forkhead associated (FHA) protein